MQKLILLILVGVWAAVLLPPALKSRAQGRPGDSISDFNRHLDILRRTRTVSGTRTLRPASPAMLRKPRSLSPIGSPFPGRLAPAARLPRMAPPPSSHSMSPAARRRRDVLIGLLVVVGVSFVAAVATSDLRLWTVHVAADAMLAVFFVALIRRRNAAAIRTLTLTPPRVLDTAGRFDAMADDADRRLELVRSASR